MDITSIIETPEGDFTFTAVLTADQHQFLIEYAIRDLFAKGLLPFRSVSTPEELAATLPGVTTEQ